MRTFHRFYQDPPIFPGFMTPAMAAQQFDAASLSAIEELGYQYDRKFVIAVRVCSPTASTRVMAPLENLILKIPPVGTATSAFRMTDEITSTFGINTTHAVLWYLPLHGFRLTHSPDGFDQVTGIVRSCGYNIVHSQPAQMPRVSAQCVQSVRDFAQVSNINSDHEIIEQMRYEQLLARISAGYNRQ